MQIWHAGRAAHPALNDGAETVSSSSVALAGATQTPFLANPDLPSRFKAGAALNAPAASTFYTPGAKGYTDYPTL